MKTLEERARELARELFHVRGGVHGPDDFQALILAALHAAVAEARAEWRMVGAASGHGGDVVKEQLGRIRELEAEVARLKPAESLTGRIAELEADVARLHRRIWPNGEGG